MATKWKTTYQCTEWRDSDEYPDGVVVDSTPSASDQQTLQTFAAVAGAGLTVALLSLGMIYLFNKS